MPEPLDKKYSHLLGKGWEQHQRAAAAAAAQAAQTGADKQQAAQGGRGKPGEVGLRSNKKRD